MRCAHTLAHTDASAHAGSISAVPGGRTTCWRAIKHTSSKEPSTYLTIRLVLPASAQAAHRSMRWRAHAHVSASASAFTQSSDWPALARTRGPGGGHRSLTNLRVAHHADLHHDLLLLILPIFLLILFTTCSPGHHSQPQFDYKVRK